MLSVQENNLEQPSWKSRVAFDTGIVLFTLAIIISILSAKQLIHLIMPSRYVLALMIGPLLAGIMTRYYKRLAIITLIYDLLIIGAFLLPVATVLLVPAEVLESDAGFAIAVSLGGILQPVFWINGLITGVLAVALPVTIIRKGVHTSGAPRVAVIAGLILVIINIIFALCYAIATYASYSNITLNNAAAFVVILPIIIDGQLRILANTSPPTFTYYISLALAHVLIGTLGGVGTALSVRGKRGGVRIITTAGILQIVFIAFNILSSFSILYSIFS